MKDFGTEEDCDSFIDSWTGDQLGAKTELSNGKFRLALPNPVSKAITEAIKMAEKETRLKVPLGMEWVVHKNWYGCH